MSASRVYLSPGFFGFSRIGTYDYFQHLEAGIRRRFLEQGRGVEIHLIAAHPTASIRRRAGKLVSKVEETAGEGAIHLVGHSTGGLDARLVASPSMNLGGTQLPMRWSKRLRSVTTINCPHYGTPLASFFATLSGQRLLYALSALTFIVLKLGGPPMALTSSFIAVFASIDRAFGLQLRLVDKVTENIVHLLDHASSPDLDPFLRSLREDQGAIIQLSPEAMDLFQAGVEDNPEVFYQCVISYVPRPGAGQWARWLAPPWSKLTFPIFALLYRLTAMDNPQYPTSPPGTVADDILRELLGSVPPPGANDGVVPIRSQLWGKVAWAGFGDHLDVVGHYDGKDDAGHNDWLGSGADFDGDRFERMLDAVVAGMLEAEKAGG